MDAPSSSMRDLARRLLALEAVGKSATDGSAHEAVRVCEKLRISLTRFAGPEGFTSLLRRALALARAEVPALQTVNLKSDGGLEGLEGLVADASNGGSDAAVAIVGHLLGLLFTFIGPSLTVRLVGEVWAGALVDE